MTGALALRLAALEAEGRIRAVMARYMELCDRLDQDTPMDEMAALFTEGATWAGRGARYGAAFGERRGRAAILAMLDSYRAPAPHFAFNAHFLASEAITVDGAAASGGWMMLQLSTYADGRSDLRTARLRVGFALDGGAWRIDRFETEALSSRPVGRWDDPAPPPVPQPPSQGA